MNKRRAVLILVFALLFLRPTPTSAQPVQELTLGVVAAGSLSGTGDEQYFRVQVASGQHLFVVLDASEHNYNSYDLYIKFDALPTTIDYDDKGASPDADQAVEIPDTQVGYYYVMVRSTSGGGNYTIRAQLIRSKIYLPVILRNYSGR